MSLPTAFYFYTSGRNFQNASDRLTDGATNIMTTKMEGKTIKTYFFSKVYVYSIYNKIIRFYVEADAGNYAAQSSRSNEQ